MIHSIRLFLFSIVAVFILPFHHAEATSRDAYISHLLKRLQHLPRQATNYETAKPLVVKLARIDPKNMFKYFVFGARCLIRNPFPVDLNLLERDVLRILRRSHLSQEDKKTIDYAIFVYVVNVNDGIAFGAGIGY